MMQERGGIVLREKQKAEWKCPECGETRRYSAPMTMLFPEKCREGHLVKRIIVTP
jgi:predicted RNA-binding Zn-ribbon protein involved in translation (DUF1610 family)